MTIIKPGGRLENVHKDTRGDYRGLLQLCSASVCAAVLRVLQQQVNQRRCSQRTQPVGSSFTALIGPDVNKAIRTSGLDNIWLIVNVCSCTFKNMLTDTHPAAR